MAYRPPIVKPPRSPREVYQARLQRQALVQALSRRLVDLVAQLTQARAISPGFRPIAEEPIRPPWRAPVPVPPTRVPTRPPVGPTHPVGVSESFLPERPAHLPSWPAPSAADWVRLPGFYESGFLPDAAAPGDRF